MIAGEKSFMTTATVLLFALRLPYLLMIALAIAVVTTVAVAFLGAAVIVSAGAPDLHPLSKDGVLARIWLFMIAVMVVACMLIAITIDRTVSLIRHQRQTNIVTERATMGCHCCYYQ